MDSKANRFPKWILYSAGTMAVLAGPAAAQEAAEEVRLGPVVVSEERPEPAGPVTGYVAQTTTTGSKTGTPIEEIPQSVTVVGRDEMDDHGVDKVDEALRYVAGVTTQPFGADSDTNWMFIRGFQATQTGVYQDGLQNYAYGFGGFFTDSFTLERIEVLRGAASVLYGGTNPGGMVNYVSKRPTGERLRYAEVGIEESGKAFTGFDIGDAVGEDFAYRLAGKGSGGDGPTDFEDGYRGTVSPSLTYAPDDDTRITFLSNYTFIDERHNGGAFLPYVGTVVDAPFGRIDPEANFTEPGLDKHIRRQYSLGYEAEHRFDSGLIARQNLRYGHSDVHEVMFYPYAFAASPPDGLSRINFEHETRVHTVLVDNQLQGDVQTGAVSHTLLGGLDYKYFNMDQVQLSGGATPISATDPRYGAAQGARAPYLDQNILMNQVGLYLQDQMRFGDGWVVTLNGRYDRVFTESEGSETYDGDDGQMSGRAGLAYTFDNGLTPYASVSTFFNPVLGSSASTGVFEPENGVQQEIGLKYAPTAFDALFTVALFDLERENVVTGPMMAETQIGAVTSRGFEAEARANLTSDLRTTAAFTILDLEVTDDADAALVGKTPYLVPERQASLSVDYSLPETVLNGTLDGVTVGGGVRYVGASWADQANTLRVPSSTVYDGWIGYQDDGWGLDLTVNNLTDEVYVAGCQGDFSCGYGEGRAARLKLHMTW